MTYSTLILIPSFIDRYKPLRLGSKVGDETFGYKRYLNNDGSLNEAGEKLLDKRTQVYWKAYDKLTDKAKKCMKKILKNLKKTLKN